MGSLKEEAKAYIPPQTLNIAELERIPVNVELLDGEGKDKDDEVFKYKYIEVEGKKYRVPSTVIGGLKAILEKLPDTKFFGVVKEGSGMSTKYQVIPLPDKEGASASSSSSLKKGVLGLKPSDSQKEDWKDDFENDVVDLSDI